MKIKRRASADGVNITEVESTASVSLALIFAEVNSRLKKLHLPSLNFTIQLQLKLQN